MAVPGEAGLASTDGTHPPARATKLSTTLDQIHQDMERAMEPRLAAQRDIEASVAPFEEMGRQQRAIAASLNAGIGQQLREMLGYPTERGGPTPPPSAEALGGLSPADMSALVDRVAKLVGERLAAASTHKAGPREPEKKGRQGRKTREVAIGVDAALSDLAEQDPRVMALTARQLAAEEKMKGWGYRTISKSREYKSWRKVLEDLRKDSSKEEVAGLFEAGVIRLQQKKPGRGRAAAVDPTINPAMEKMTRQFIRHSEEGLDGH